MPSGSKQCRSRRIIGLVLVGMLGCSTPPADEQRADTSVASNPPALDSNTPRTDQVSIAEVWTVGTSYGTTRSQLIARLGTPVRTESNATPNRHGYGTDSLFFLDFGGLAFHIRQPAQSTNELMESIELTDSARALPGGIRLGRTTDSEIQSRFGKPQTADVQGDTTKLAYLVSTQGGEEYVTFALVQSQLRKITWTFYVD